MHEMDVEPVDLGLELREAIEARLALAPIVLPRPVAADVLDPGERRALAPVVDQLGLRPARASQPVLQVGEDVVADGDAKGLDVVHHERSRR